MRTLAARVTTPLLPYFERMPRELHPWWWPMGAGRTLEDWGLDPAVLERRGLDGEAILESLRRRDDEERPDLDGFLGSVGARPEDCHVVVLSVRPSQEGYPDGGPTKLVHRLSEAGLLANTHTTNLVKFRGPSRAELLDIEGVDDLLARRAVRLSLDLVAEEIAYLDPDVLLVAGEGTREALKVLLDPSTPASHRLRAALDGLVRMDVPSWMASIESTVVAEAWRTAVVDALRETVEA
jgi:hypothetical protein